MSRGIRRLGEEDKKEEIKKKIQNSLYLKGEAGFGELKEEIGISRPALAKYIKELEAEKRITWRKDPADRRRGIYKVTKEYKESDYYRGKYLATIAFVKTVKETKGAGHGEAWGNELVKQIGETVYLMQMMGITLGEDTTTALVTYLAMVHDWLAQITHKYADIKEEAPKFSELYEQFPARTRKDIKEELENVPDSGIKRIIEKNIFA